MSKSDLPKIASAAVQCERNAKLPAGMGDVVAAQCILESGWLDHAPKENCFGVKMYVGAPGRQLLHTTEWFTDQERAQFLSKGDGRTADVSVPLQTDARGRKKCNVQDWFAAFDNLTQCFEKRAQLFTAGRYAPFLAKFRDDGDLTAYVRGIAPIYATDPNYDTSLLAIIRQSDVQAALRKGRELMATA